MPRQYIRKTQKNMIGPMEKVSYRSNCYKIQIFTNKSKKAKHKYRKWT